MAKIIYFMNCSLDGYVEDENGRFDWSEPDRETHEFINDLVRPVGTYLNGRRMYEVMSYWERPEAVDGQPDFIRDFAELWRASDKVVYSRELKEAQTARTRIERRFDPQALARLKDEATEDLAIAGPEIAAEAMRAGLVDEYAMLLYPIIVGGGRPMLPRGVKVELELVEERRLSSGNVFLRYRTR